MLWAFLHLKAGRRMAAIVVAYPLWSLAPVACPAGAHRDLCAAVVGDHARPGCKRAYVPNLAAAVFPAGDHRIDCRKDGQPELTGAALMLFDEPQTLHTAAGDAQTGDRQPPSSDGWQGNVWIAYPAG